MPGIAAQSVLLPVLAGEGAWLWQNSSFPQTVATMKLALSLTALILLALILPFLLPGLGRQEGVDPERNLPWQIETDGKGGSTVFGLKPGESTLGDVRRLLCPEMEVAIIAAPNEPGMLEAYCSQATLGFVMARLIVTADLDSAQVVAMRERALHAKPMESSTRRITLHPDDLAQAERLPIRALSVIPSASLDEAMVVQRFGQPGERLVQDENRVHLLYPEKGLDVLIDPKGKELLQYVAPGRFASLREPLLAAPSGDADRR